MQRSKIELWNKNSIFSGDALSDFLNCITIIPDNLGCQKDNPDAVCNDRVIGDFEIIYILGGESNITINNVLYNCTEGDLVFIPPFVKHKIRTPKTNPHYNYWVHFDICPFYMHPQFISSILPSNCYKTRIGIIDELVSLFKQLVSEYEYKRPGYLIILNAILTQIITHVLRINNQSGLSSDTQGFGFHEEKRIVDKSIDYIMTNIAKPILIADICKSMYISDSYLFKCFKSVLGLPPNQCIQLVKIRQAEQLIKTSSLSFKEISEMLGFSSPYYFSSVFKKFYKVSPRDYIRSNSLV